MAKTIREVLKIILIPLIRWLIPPAKAGWQRTKRTENLRGR